MRILLGVALAALAFGMVGANECTPTTTDPMLTVGSSFATTLYAHEDCFGNRICSGIFSLWIYEESNDIPGLQRGDEIIDDTCGGVIPADTIIF
jgi:hypothetical protein